MCDPATLLTTALVSGGTAVASSALAPRSRSATAAPSRTDADVARASEDMFRRFALSRSGFEADFRRNMGDVGDGNEDRPLRAVTLGR